MAKLELSELLPELFNRPDDTEFITSDEVVEFVKKGTAAEQSHQK